MTAVMSSGLNALECADRLDLAALIVEVRGLAKDKYLDTETGAVCSAGAINIAVYGEDAVDHDPQLADLCVKESLLEYLGIDLVDDDGEPVPDGDYDDRIATWSDADGTDGVVVAATFRAVAAKLRQVA